MKLTPTNFMALEFDVCGLFSSDLWSTPSTEMQHTFEKFEGGGTTQVKAEVRKMCDFKLAKVKTLIEGERGSQLQKGGKLKQENVREHLFYLHRVDCV